MKKSTLFVVSTTFFTLLATFEYYLAKRFSWYFDINKEIFVHLVTSFVIFFSVFGTVYSRNKTKKYYYTIYKITAVGLGYLLYVLISVALLDLLSLFIKIKASNTGIYALSLAVSISLFGYLNARISKIKKIDIHLKNLNESFKIAHLSDVHIGHFRKNKFLSQVVKKVNTLNPDLVCITGDFFDSKNGLNENYVSSLKNIKAPVYFIEGNHDNYAEIESVKKLLLKNNIKVLENELTEYKDIQIIGLKHMPADDKGYDFRQRNDRETIENTLKKIEIDKSKTSILLHHSPVGITYAEKVGIDLYLTGHTHAGQLFPITLIASRIFKYNKGLYKYGKTNIIVSQGIGTTNPPMRVGTKSEIILITLKPQLNGKSTLDTRKYA